MRALFEYMRRSEALCLTKDKKKLFVSLFKGKTTEISKPTISNWIKETIVTCYKLANNTQLEFTNVKAHQVRALQPPSPFITRFLCRRSCKRELGEVTTHFVLSISRISRKKTKKATD